jgi:adenosylcobinamide-GDP ribazoletransferase
VRGLILALQFLTRVPTPRIARMRPEDLAHSAGWFPLVGALVGLAVAAALAAGNLVDRWLGALAALLVWVWITGALHLDGLADLADALAAAHRDPKRLLEVLRDPHIGTFGVVAIVLVLAAKLVLLALLVAAPAAVLALVAAWARLAAVIWSQTLPALASGTGERFAWRARREILVAWGVALLVASALLVPPLVAAPLAVALWWAFLRRRLGGMTGDCLGAGVEVTEIALLALAVVGLPFVPG